MVYPIFAFVVIILKVEKMVKHNFYFYKELCFTIFTHIHLKQSITFSFISSSLIMTWEILKRKYH